MLDTTGGPFDVTFPESPAEGQTLCFCDARGTWNSHPPTFLRNGNKIEAHEVDFTDSAQGTFFCATFIDQTTGWRILESGTKPQNLTLPTIGGNTVGAAVTSAPGTWTGSPTSYTYLWQISDDGSTGWEYISGAASSTYMPVIGDEAKFVRVVVTATNANGSSLPATSVASAAIEVPLFPEGAVAFWKLDDLTDATGNGNTLTNNGAITFGPGKIGGSALIDGDTDGGKYLASSVSGANTETGFSISMWIKGTAGGVATSVLQACSSDHQGWFIGSDSSNTLAFLFGAGDWAIAEAFGNYIVGTWHHIVMTADPAAADSPKIKIYLDGELVKAWDLVTWADAPIELGHFAFNYGSSDYGWAGDMDAVGVWVRPLTSDDVALLYNPETGAEPA